MFGDIIISKRFDYIQRYGEEENTILMERLNTSKLFNDNLSEALRVADIPSVKTLEAIIRSSHFKFMIANNRKIYFGCLFFLQLLHNDSLSLGRFMDEDKLIDRLEELDKAYKI